LEAAGVGFIDKSGGTPGVRMHRKKRVTSPNLLASESAGQVDLWDRNPLLACRTVPIGYHPSQYGDFLDALVLFGQITGVNRETLVAEPETND
jgi:hypothetical protein